MRIGCIGAFRGKVEVGWFRLVAVALVVLFGAGCRPEAVRSTQGYVEAEFVRVGATLGGRLTVLGVDRGDAVKPGDVLFELEAGGEQAAVGESEARLESARFRHANLVKGMRPSELAAIEAQQAQAAADARLAALEQERLRRLAREGGSGVSERELDQASARVAQADAQVDLMAARLVTARLGAREDELKVAEAEVRVAEAALTRARWALDQKRVTSPVAAVVNDTLFEVGEQLQAAQPVVVLLPPASLKIRFFVPQAMLPRIRVGMPVEVRADGASKPMQALVRFISAQAEFTPPVIYSRENRGKLVFMVEAGLDAAAAEAMRPGQPVDVDFPLIGP